MIFAPEKIGEYFSGKEDVREKSVGSCDTITQFKVEIEGKDLINMLKLFNKHSRKGNANDVEAALIPSPEKVFSPEKALTPSPVKEPIISPVKKEIVLLRRNSSIDITPIIDRKNEVRRASVMQGNSINSNLGVVKTFKPYEGKL